jgi:dihydrofolate synthase/folylpolyglutamate synthase
MRKIDSSTGQPAYQQFLDYLFGLEKFGMVFGLTQVQKILEAIGNPHREVQSIHIGGTNGKGSTAAMTASILQREGYRVGLYTSPHLIRFTERIKVNGKEIEKEEVAALAGWMKERIEAAGLTSSSTGTCPGSPALKGGVKGYNMMKPACREASPLRAGSFTFFDFTTAMALYYFKQKMVDLAVLEVGLGGRLDSTNVVDPLFSVITNVSKDHEAYLGNSVLKIAGEKAGIIKKGRPLITAAKQPQVLRLFSKVCREKGSPYYRVGRDFRYERTVDGEFHYEGLRRKLWKTWDILYPPMRCWRD